jgi:hypothetical protein
MSGGQGFCLPGSQESPEDQIPAAVPGTVLHIPNTEAQQQPIPPKQPGTLGIMPQQHANAAGT